MITLMINEQRPPPASPLCVCASVTLVYVMTEPFRGISMPLHCIHSMHNDAIGNKNVNSNDQKLSHIHVYV